MEKIFNKTFMSESFIDDLFHATPKSTIKQVKKHCFRKVQFSNGRILFLTRDLADATFYPDNPDLVQLTLKQVKVPCLKVIDCSSSRKTKTAKLS